MICKGNIYQAVSGIIIGHAYIYLKEILPVTHRKSFLETPRWANWLGNKFMELDNKLMNRFFQQPAINQNEERQDNNPFRGRGRRLD